MVVVTAAAIAVDDRERGDWLPLIVADDALRAYVKDHRLPETGWRVPDHHEQEQVPRGDECIILTSFLDRGLGLPIHPFPQCMLEHFHAASPSFAQHDHPSLWVSHAVRGVPQHPGGLGTLQALLLCQTTDGDEGRLPDVWRARHPGQAHVELLRDEVVRLAEGMDLHVVLLCGPINSS